MVERIRTLLETRQLTPTQFADSIGIARPIVSHILSGRNKPSLEVVQRILAAMPDLSMAWLLNGTGPVLAGPPVAPPLQPAAQAPAATAETKVAPVPPLEVVLEVPASASEATPSRSRSPEMPSRPRRLAAAGGVSALPEPKRFAPTAAPAPRQAMSGPGPQALTEAMAADTALVVPVTAPATQPTAPAVPAVAPEAPTIPAGPESVEATPATTALLARTEKPIRRIVIFYHDGSFADYRPE